MRVALPDLNGLFAEIAEDVRALLLAEAVPLGRASPPRTSGVYMLSVGQDVAYVGEAKGSGGLRDRLLNKHLSGDDNHAIQRATFWSSPTAHCVARTFGSMYSRGGTRSQIPTACRQWNEY